MAFKYIKEGYATVLEFISRSNKKGQLSFEDKGFTVKGAVSSEEKITLTCAASITVDCSMGNVFELTLINDVTSLTFVNVGIGSYVFVVKQDTVGSHTVTFPAGVLFAGGEALTITADASAIDVIGMFHDGTNYYVYPTQNFSVPE
jgi:hypothetical protein